MIALGWFLTARMILARDQCPLGSGGWLPPWRSRMYLPLI